MNGQAQRGVTRGYVVGLLLACVIVAVALTVATWGLLALALGREPVTASEHPMWASPLTIAVALGLLAHTLWRQAIALLRGRRRVHWGYVAWTAAQPYLVWCLLASAWRLPASDSWASPFAWALVPVWAFASLAFWFVLARRVYSGRGTPRWPWERDDDLGPDWANYGLDPWQNGEAPAGEEGRQMPEGFDPDERPDPRDEPDGGR